MHLLRRFAGRTNPCLKPQAAVSIPAFTFVTGSILNTLFHYSQQRHTYCTTNMASTDADLRSFFQASRYAVVGASTNTAKFGYKGRLIDIS